MWRLAVFVAVLLAGSCVLAQEVAGTLQSFEEGVVPGFVTVAKGKVSVSERHAQEGKAALRWDWVPGDVLTFEVGSLGKINVRTGYGRYSRSALALRVRAEWIDDEGVMSFRWMAREKVAARFEFPLVFAGWQSICYHYPQAHESRLVVEDAKALEATDRIVVVAPEVGEGGSLFFDAVQFNTVVDYRGGREPIREPWREKRAEEYEEEALGAPPTEEGLAALEGLVGALRVPGKVAVGEAEIMAQREALVKKCELRRGADGHVTGKTVSNFSAAITGDMLAVAQLWLRASGGTEPRLMAEIEETYFLLDDYFRDMGAVAQGGMEGLNWYGGRNHALACFIMSEPLRLTQRLSEVRECLKYFWGFDGLMYELPEKRQAMGMDYFRNDLKPLLYCALMHEETQEIVTHLRAYARRMDLDIRNSIEPDGSLYHHGFHYYAYANGAVVQMADLMRLLGPTPWKISRGAYEQLRAATMNMRFYANVLDLPLPMHGRHPGRLGLTPPLFSLLAQASVHYNGGKMDEELAGAYLRLRPEEAANPVFAAYKPEAEPQGNMVMNSASLIGHRREGWLARVRGYGKYTNAFESYAACNRRGLFMGNGYLTILGTGSPVNLVDSGCDTTKGWDWRHLDGCTSYEAPVEVIANGEGTLGDLSDVGFVGGLSHRGKNGVFVMPLHSRRQYVKGLPKEIKDDGQKCFAANKTYFFFDGWIVCLGSEIALPDLPYPVQTTLFQNTLAQTAMAIEVEGEVVSELPWRAELGEERGHTLRDIQGNGYWLPAGQKVTVLRQHQKSFAGCNDKPTEGDAATAIIEHGVNPTSGRYVYLVMPKTTGEGLAEFARAMEGEEKPVVVARQDKAAHVVFDRATGSWGGVFFEAQKVDVEGCPVAEVSQACLVMCERDGEGWWVTVCDSDFRRAGEAVVGFRGGGEVKVRCEEGKSVEVKVGVR